MSETVGLRLARPTDHPMEANVLSLPSRKLDISGMLDTTPAIRILDVTKSFGQRLTIGRADSNSLRQTWEVLRGGSASVGSHRIASRTRIEEPALRGLSLEVSQGSVVALNGPSNSGKSVLLGVLAGTIPITAGRIEIRGTVSWLLGRGIGFNPRLSLREIVTRERWLDALHTGVTGRRYQEILDFSGLEKFQDIPIRLYSTGMKVRLSVALVLTSDADILLLDDVLEVGDVAFQRRCADRLVELVEGNATIIFASRDPLLIGRIAERVVTLEGGRIAGDSAVTSPQKPTVPNAANAPPSWELRSDKMPDNDLVKVERIEPELRSIDGRAHLNVSIDLRVKQGQSLRTVVDLTADGVSQTRSLFPRNVDVGAGQVHRFSVSVPLWMFNAATIVFDINVISVVGGDVHSLKSTGLLVIQGRSEKDDSAKGAFDPCLRWVVEPLLGAA